MRITGRILGKEDKKMETGKKGKIQDTGKNKYTGNRKVKPKCKKVHVS